MADAGRDFESWYREEQPRILGALTLLLGSGDVAEESVAESFARALERWKRVQAMASPGGWVFTVALNDARRRIKRAKKERAMAPGDPPLELPPPYEPELWAAVRALPPRQQTAILLRYVSDLSERDIAAAMRISVGGASKLLSVARRQLASQLENSNPREDTRS